MLDAPLNWKSGVWTIFKWARDFYMFNSLSDSGICVLTTTTTRRQAILWRVQLVYSTQVQLLKLSINNLEPEYLKSVSFSFGRENILYWYTQFHHIVLTEAMNENYLWSYVQFDDSVIPRECRWQVLWATAWWDQSPRLLCFGRPDSETDFSTCPRLLFCLDMKTSELLLSIYIMSL